MLTMIVELIPMFVVLGLLGFFLAMLFIGGVDIGSFSDIANGIYHLID